MANLRDLFWMVRTEAPGVPEPILHYRYSQAVKEFLRRSQAWRYSISDPLDWDSDDDFPDMSAAVPANTYVVEPLSVKWKDGTEIPFKTREQLDALDCDWEQATAAQPDYWTITAPGAWRMYPLLAADATDVVYARVALSIEVPDTTSVPDALANEWEEAWAHGALSKLLKMPGKDWTDVRLASAYGSMFEDAITKAKSRADADYGKPVRTVTYGGITDPLLGFTDDYGR